MENKYLIIDILKNSKHGLDIHDLAKNLKMEETSSFIELNKILNNLEDNNEIYRDDNNLYYDLASAQIKEATIIVKRNNIIYIDDEEVGLLEVKSEHAKGAMHKDIVLYQRKNHFAKVLKIISHFSSVVVGLVRIRNNRIEFYADDPRMKDFKITNLKNFKLKDRLKVRCIITNYEKKEMILESIIAYVDDPKQRELSILYSYNVPMEFSSTAMNEAKSFLQRVDKKDYPNRKDLTDEMIITIDGDDSKDFDDAISIKKIDDNYLLKVHIADVSEYVRENSALDKNAKERSTSIYYANKVIPMLPFELSNGICSLNPNVNRLAMSVEMKISKDGEVVDMKFYESIIKSRYRMTYNNVNKILAGDEILQKEYTDLVPDLLLMRELSKILRHKREEGGSIDFKEEEAKLVIKDDKVVDIIQRERGESERMIEDFMIEANVTVATYMKYLDYPMIYRNHDYPKPEKMAHFIEMVETMGYTLKGNKYQIKSKQLRECLEFFEGDELEPIISNLMLRSMAKAVYTNVSEGHYGLGLENYCHFTSPIRRYPDLIVHRMLKKYVFNTSNIDDIDADKLKNNNLAIICSNNERRAINIERDIMDLKMCEYMKDKVGKTFDAIISSVLSFGFFVKLENTVEGLVHISELDGYYTFDEKLMTLSNDINTYKVGQKVRVKCIDVDLRRSSIDFRLYNKRKKAQRWI